MQSFEMPPIAYLHVRILLLYVPSTDSCVGDLSSNRLLSHPPRSHRSKNQASPSPDTSDPPPPAPGFFPSDTFPQAERAGPVGAPFLASHGTMVPRPGE